MHIQRGREGRRGLLRCGWRVMFLLLLLGGVAGAAEEVTVFAAGSLSKSLTEVAKGYEAQTGVKIKLNFASAGVLARQIGEGAQAGVFISAADKWAKELKEKGLLPESKTLLTNEMVLVTRADAAAPPVEFRPEFAFGKSFTGRLAVGEPQTTPLGKYAQESFTKLGWWEGIKDRLLLTKDVMETTRVVENGGADLGIVFRTDLLASPKLKLVAVFPAELHSPILYVAGTVKGAGEAARQFYDYLFLPKPLSIFQKYGFLPPAN